MLGDRLIATGGAKLVGALALACLVLASVLCISVYANLMQFRGKAAAVGEVVAKLAAAEARSAAEIAGCAATNERVTGTVHVLEAELLQCRGQEQKIGERLALALRQRERSRKEVNALETQRRTVIEAALKANEQDCNRPMCRALSDELLGTTPQRPPE